MAAMLPSPADSMARAALAGGDDVPGAIARARRGDASGWDALFDRYHRTVLRYAAARLGEREGAEDVAQEVFLAAVQSIRRLRDSSSGGVESWLLGIAQHKVTDRIRRVQRERARRGDAPADGACDDATDGRLDSADLRAALEQLTVEQREVVLRRFILDQSLEQVATATRRPVGAVKSMQRRALQSLARLCGAEVS